MIYLSIFLMGTEILAETLLNFHNALHEKANWYRCGLLLLCRAV